MRDAEAQVNLNEVRQRIADLNREWQLHDSTCKQERELLSEPSNDAYDLIAHELISLKMREAQLDCDNKLLSQKVMDIETQKQVLHNQIKRQDEEIQRLRAELDQGRVRENDLRFQYNDLKYHKHDGELRVRLLCWSSTSRSSMLFLAKGRLDDVTNSRSGMHSNDRWSSATHCRTGSSGRATNHQRVKIDQRRSSRIKNWLPVVKSPMKKISRINSSNCKTKYVEWQRNEKSVLLIIGFF